MKLSEVAGEDEILSGRSTNSWKSLPNKFERRYIRGVEIGKGAYSTVISAFSVISHIPVAVKIINKKNLSKQDLANVYQEVNILKSLNHDNIIKILDFYEDNKFFYIVLEHAEGGTLFTSIQEKTRYKEKEARDMVFIILQAIKYLHDHNIVHRDIKAENLLLDTTEGSTIKLVDFGFATTCGDSFNITGQLGSPSYVAPEILRNEAYGKPCDMWSFGIVLYHLLGGYLPFRSHKIDLLNQKIVAGKFTFNPIHWSGMRMIV